MSTAHWGKLIFDRRSELGYSLAALSKKSGLSVSTIKSVESYGSNPNVGTLEKILNALSYDLEVVDAYYGNTAPLNIVARN